MRCATIGDIALDVRVRAGEPLARGADARGEVSLSPGGSAANVAVWLARLGATSVCVGSTGRDRAGALVRADLRREGVRVVGPRRGRTASIAVLLEPSGERTFVTDRATALDLRPEDVPADLWDELTVLHVPAYSLFEGALARTSEGMVDEAHRRGVTVSVDLSSESLLRAYGPESFAALLRRLRPHVLFGNEDEATVFAPSRRRTALLDALAGFAPIAVLKCGADGAVLSHDAGTHHQPAPAVRVVDTTGAGDALAAAFLLERARGTPPADALRAGVALASAVVGADGARPTVQL